MRNELKYKLDQLLLKLEGYNGNYIITSSPNIESNSKTLKRKINFINKKILK